jgi:hypothetical protein
MDLLVSADDFNTYLQRPATVDTAQATMALAGASGVVRHFCRWVISEEAPVTFALDGNGTDILNLPTLRLNAVSEIRIDGVIVEPGRYEWSRGGQIQLDGWWPRRFRSIEVDGDHGYATIPDEVRAVVMSLATRYYINPDGLRSKTVGGVSRTYMLESASGKPLTELETAMIAGYRIP